MGRNILGIVAGIVAGAVAMLLVAYLGGLLFPIPGAGTTRDPEQVKAAFALASMGARLAVLVSWFCGALAAAAVAKQVIGRNWAAWTLTGVFTVYVLLNVLILPMAALLKVLAVAGPLLAGWLANRLIRERTPVVVGLDKLGA